MHQSWRLRDSRKCETWKRKDDILTGDLQLVALSEWTTCLLMSSLWISQDKKCTSATSKFYELLTSRLKDSELTISSWSSGKLHVTPSSAYDPHGISQYCPYVWKWMLVIRDGPRRMAAFWTACVSGSEPAAEPRYVSPQAKAVDPASYRKLVCHDQSLTDCLLPSLVQTTQMATAPTRNFNTVSIRRNVPENMFICWSCLIVDPQDCTVKWTKYILFKLGRQEVKRLAEHCKGQRKNVTRNFRPRITCEQAFHLSTNTCAFNNSTWLPDWAGIVCHYARTWAAFRISTSSAPVITQAYGVLCGQKVNERRVNNEVQILTSLRTLHPHHYER